MRPRTPFAYAGQECGREKNSAQPADGRCGRLRRYRHTPPKKHNVLVPVFAVLCVLCVVALAAFAYKFIIAPDATPAPTLTPAETSWPTATPTTASSMPTDPLPSPPPAPSNFTASTYNQDSAQLSWSGSDDADYYEVQYYSPKKNSWVADPNYSTGTSYISYGLNSYLSYDFRVRAVNDNGCSPWVECSINTDPGLPAAPTNFRAERNDQFSARLSWTGSSNADSYEAQYYSWSLNEWCDSADYSSGTSYISYDLKSYTNYKFRVRAVNIAGSSQWVECEYTRVISAPPAPINFNGEPYSRNSASLSWTQSSDSNDYNDPDYYEVQYYSQKNGVWKTDGDYSSGTSYISTGLNSYLSYQYRVRAVNAAGSSSWVSCTVYFDKDLPSAPTDLTIEESGEGYAYVSWSSASGADWYEVQYYSQKNEMWRDDTDYSSGTSYTSTGLGTHNFYEYRVRSCNAAGYSDWVYDTYYIYEEDPTEYIYEDEAFDYVYEEDAIGRALQNCEQYSNQAQESRIRGSLRKNFPTTMAILEITAGNNSVCAECLWAGDSRCYVCDADGLHQLSTDDVDNVDAMENLTDDCVLRNVINTSVPYFINTKTVSVKNPCIFLAATDGCFGYLLSPMHFEYLIVDTLCVSNNIDEWKKALDQRLGECAGDDYSLCVAGYGYETFKAMKESFYSRREYLMHRYITSEKDPHMSWHSYKPQYESLMTTD